MRNHGYIEPVIKPTDLFLGSGKLSGEVLQPDGNWLPYAPEAEIQRKQFETSNCTAEAITNCVEILMKRQFGLDVNYSARWLGIVAGTKPPGNDPQKVAQAIREYGLIPEDMLPFSDDLQNVDEYYSFKGANEAECRKAGKEWLETFEFRYEIVYPESTAEAIKLSPLGVAVDAWNKNGDFYVKLGPPNHWTVLAKDMGDNKVVDSYLADGSPIKNLSPDYKFPFIQRYAIRLYTEEEKKLRATAWQTIVKALQFIISYLTSQLKKEVPTPSAPPTPEIPRATIEDLAKAIEKYENVNKKLNNPGGLRSSPYQNGSVVQSTTGKQLATFATYADGFKALLHQIRIVCNGTSPVYKAEAKKLGLTTCADLTIEQFIHIYAPKYENITTNYIAFIEKTIKVGRETKMKELL